MHQFLGLLPCALKVPFEGALDQFREQLIREGKDLGFQCSVLSNANNEGDYFREIKDLAEVDALPDLIIAPGFNAFFNGHFKKLFQLTQAFRGINLPEANPIWHQLKLLNQEQPYTLIGFNPTIFLVDRTVHQEIPIPRRWSDLLKPEYKQKIAIRGSNHKSEEFPMEFCEGILLNFYREHGEEGVRKLGEAVKWSLHPSQMVKLAGRKNSDGPAVSAIPYSFARLVRQNEYVSVIWPEDGAIVNPMILLVKNQEEVRRSEMLRFLLSESVGKLFAELGFASIHPGSYELMPPDAEYKWLGWDFVEANDLAALKRSLNEIFLSSYAGQVKG